ncbi:MAG: hypothetical protein LBR73_00035 [Oscillospiraceae bacterium]|jgi:hypothetical protein|nr:hypothetical protein [Oscillospiraceae bacterium]
MPAQKDIQTIRALAAQYSEAAGSDRNLYNRRLHIASNDLHMERPVVMINELPWDQLNIDGRLTCVCEDERLRGLELDWRKKLLQWELFGGDMVLRPFMAVGKSYGNTGIGLTSHDTALKQQDPTAAISAHSYEDLLENEEDVEKMHLPLLTYDEEHKARTQERYNFWGEILGDILPVRIVGNAAVFNNNWDDIFRLRSGMPLLMDLLDRPEHSHAVIKRKTECKVAEFEQLEALGLLDDCMYGETLHCTPILTEQMPKPAPGEPYKLCHVWGRGTAQIFGTVSGEMHDEFDIDYMIQSVGRCGMVYYGCCEPLDKKIDIVARIPNLRKIGVTPWADVDNACAQIGGKYVVSNKPNPAAVAVPQLVEEELRKEIGRTLAAAKRNGVKGLDITLKDISTLHGNPQNIIRWHDIVMELVRSW